MVFDTTILLALAVVVVSSTILLFLLSSKHSSIQGFWLNGYAKSNKEPTFMIIGPCNSGKSSLFGLLTTGEYRETVMSQKPNVAENLSLEDVPGKYKLIDFPGHSKLKHGLFEILKQSKDIRGIIFLIDATVELDELTETAVLLYDVLKVTEQRLGGVDILIACNKSESFASRQPSKIQKVLEAEIDKAIKRKSKSLFEASLKGSDMLAEEEAAVTMNDDGDDSSIFHALTVNRSQTFNFALLDCTVTACEGSVWKKNTEKWISWMSERAVN